MVNAWLADRVVRMATSDLGTLDIDRTGGTSPTPSNSSSAGARTPIRKISVEEINPRHLPLKPMVNKNQLGSPTFYKALEASPTLPRKSSTKSKTEAQQRQKTRRLSHHAMPAELGLPMIDEREMIMELIKDITMELDVTNVSHRILKNVTILLNADRCSLFLVREKENCRYLVNRLFDVNKDSCIEDAIVNNSDEIRIEYGQGIAGKVWETGETLNIADAYQDPRFNQEIDQKTGYKTTSIICMPLRDGNNQIVGVAQAINKQGHIPVFTEGDEKIFASYLGFCGIAVHNAQLFEKSQLENRRNEVLLDLTKVLFEEQSSLNIVMSTILQHTTSLLNCERASIMLVEDSVPGVKFFKSTFEHVEDDFENALGSNNDSSSKEKQKVPFNIEITTRVSQGEEDKELGFKTRNLLCMPIRNAYHEVIGVIQLINKTYEGSTGFTTSDQQLLEAFTIFCGLGICHAKMYEEKSLLLAKQNVILEVLSYHAVCSDKEVVKLLDMEVPSANRYNLNSFSFDDSVLNMDETLTSCIRMFMDLNLTDKFHINNDILCRWVCSVRKNYRPVKYHNWRHAFNVCQTMYCMIKIGGLQHVFSDCQRLALLIACLCHDLDHRGTNNAFQFKTQHPLAQLYSTSTLEQHHYNQCMMLLQTEGCQILSNLTAKEYSEAIKCIQHAIISTDLAVYFQNRNKFFKIANESQNNWKDDKENFNLLTGMMTTAADISAISKPWNIQKKVARLVAEEFFEQGDIEKSQLNEAPTDMMDRNKSHKLPQMQVGFIDSICLPLYKALAATSSGLQPMLDGCLNNRKHWSDLAKESNTVHKE